MSGLPAEMPVEVVAMEIDNQQIQRNEENEGCVGEGPIPPPQVPVVFVQKCRCGNVRCLRRARSVSSVFKDSSENLFGVSPRSSRPPAQSKSNPMTPIHFERHRRSHPGGNTDSCHSKMAKRCIEHNPFKVCTSSSSKVFWSGTMAPASREQEEVKILKEHKFKFAKMEESFQGELDPIQIFPEEIWEIFLNKVTTMDRLIVCRTHSQLDTMFGETKSQWLLDQVLPFLMKYITNKRDLLKCRGVCKDWRRIIDTFLARDHPNRRAFDKDIITDQINCQRSSVYSSLRRCQLEYHQFTPNNPHKYLMCPEEVLIGRAVCFQVNGHWSEEAILSFWEATKHFLESHGKHIWHFKFIQYNMHLTSIRFYTVLYEALQLLPNLRSLVLRCRLEQVSGDRELHTAFQISPLPPLSELRSMEIEGVPRSIQEHFLKQYARQLHKISLDMDIYTDKETLPLNLKELQLKRVFNKDILEKIYCMTSSPENLSKLTLDMSLCRRAQGSGIDMVLEKFPKLKQLRILFHSRICLKSIYIIRLHHTVEYFELEGDWRDIFYFSTILYALPSLKYLHIRDTSYSYPSNSSEFVNVRENRSSSEDNVEIQEYLLNGRIHMSPIWDTLPHLRIFTFESVNRNLKAFCNRETVKYLRKGEELKEKEERKSRAEGEEPTENL